MSVKFIEADLESFTDTMDYYRSSPLFKNIVHTDGVQYVAEHGGAWMIDVIVSHQTNPKVHREESQSWEFQVNEKHECKVICKGEEDSHLVVQEIPFTDLPFNMNFIFQLGSLDLVTPTWVMMLPSEY